MALFLCLLLLPVSQAKAQLSSCSSEQFDETTTIQHIHDGDTLHLSNGKKIRLIGINAPELARDNKPAEVFSSDAKNALKKLFKQDKSIALVFGKEKQDHYGRYLAHAFLSDGTNIQAFLLQQGIASVITYPPNLRFSTCYLSVEKQARCNKKGLWGNNNVLETQNLNKQHTGFHLIKGRVINIKKDHKGIWLNLDNKLTIGIRPENQKLFNPKMISALLNQTIVVRGWLNKSNKRTPFYLRVRHPLSILLASENSCA